MVNSIAEKMKKAVARPADVETGHWSESAMRVLRERYLTKDAQGHSETPEDMCWRVAYAIALAEMRWGADEANVMTWARSYYDIMIRGLFLPNSPTLMNAGRGSGLQYSACYVLPVGDSMIEIFEAIKRAAIIHQSGGGTGFAFSRLRPRDSLVRSSGGRASGPVSFLRVFNQATEAVKQGGNRRGANMGILRVDHPDILEFIECKLDGGITNFNISVAATDEFMHAVKNDEHYELVAPHTGQVTGKLRARDVFQRIVQAAWRTGDPGLVFIDRVNHSPANPTPELGQIEATNPCVTADTWVYTRNGLQRAGDLAASGAAPSVVADGRMTGQTFVGSGPVFTTGVKPVFRLRTVEGYELRLTADHRVMTERGWVAAADLLPGDRLHILNRKGGFGSSGSYDLGCILGRLVGDGTLKRDRAVLNFFGQEKMDLAPRFAGMVERIVDGRQELDRAYPVGVVQVEKRDEARVGSLRLARLAEEHGLTMGSKLHVPDSVFEGSEEMQRGFLQSLFTADGHVSGELHKGVSVRLTSVDRQLLVDVQRLLLNFGIASVIYSERRPAMTRSLPDGRGGSADYACRAYHELMIAQDNLRRFADEINFLSDGKRAALETRLARYVRGPYRERFLATFETLTAEGEEAVYDLTIPDVHAFVANGLVVHNCGEQPLLPNEACNLGSLNVAQFVLKAKHNGHNSNGDLPIDWAGLERTIQTAVRFLDDVIEVNPYPLPEIDAAVKGNRRIGLGVMGWADLLFKLGIPYDSENAVNVAERVMSFINKVGHEADEKLAEERGPFPNWPRSIYRDGKPLRNATVTTIAPTGTISIIANASSGIEPLFALAYSHIVEDRHLIFMNPVFEQVARERGFWSEQLMAEVSKRGTVRGLSDVPEDIQRVFVTAHDVAPEWHVRMQAAFQKYTDNGVSKTINLPHEATVDDVAKSYMQAYDLGCLGITVYRDGCKSEQVLHIGTAGKDKDKQKDRETLTDARKPRPAYLRGTTYRKVTPLGTAYITINEDENGDPFELFVTVGKAGTDTAALAEALGRLISLCMRLPSDMSERERLEQVVDQLSGIGGAHQLGFGKQRVRSLPDGLAQVLSEYLGEVQQRDKVAEQPPLPIVEAGKVGDLCPSCGQATLVYAEGCQKCYTCGHSEC